LRKITAERFTALFTKSDTKNNELKWARGFAIINEIVDGRAFLKFGDGSITTIGFLSLDNNLKVGDKVVYSKIGNSDFFIEGKLQKIITGTED